MLVFPNHVISLFSTRPAQDQGGLLTGKDPTTFNASDPLRLWIIQVGIIICTASFLSLVLSKIRQPKVIAEVLGGILLGPTAFGRIPGFTAHIFPPSSRPYLTLVANIGLCLFLFLVGLEIDAGVIKRNARLSAIVAFAGMLLPFGIGSCLSLAIYKQFIDPGIEFTHFMLFAGVAYSITAFPVLCRILTELKLLDTTVGIVVLSAGVGNDIVGWVLLALSVALVNAGSGLTALYILLACVAWTLILLFPVKIALKWLATRTGSIQNGPSVFFMTVTMLILFGSAFLTDFIGVHAIFGAFVAGVIVPREGGLAITMTEKLEDMVSIIFLPLYFTLSGLSTNLGLLNDGVTWAFTLAVIATAFVGKFGGCTLAARYIAGFDWRESSTIGSLMSCKGLVELIVLNVGLSAGILSPRVFSMFVLESLVLTFMTTPIVSHLYPPHLRRRATATGAHFEHIPDDEEADQQPSPRQDGFFKSRFTVVLDKLEHLPSTMALMRIIQPAQSSYEKRLSMIPEMTSPGSKGNILPGLISMQALRLIELSDRVSAVMKGSLSESLLHTDPILTIFRMFGQLSGMRVSSSLSVAKFDDLANSVTENARNFESDMILVPWLPPIHDPTANMDLVHKKHPPPTTPAETSQGPPTPLDLPPPVIDSTSRSFPSTPKGLSPSLNPFDMLLKSTGSKSPGQRSGNTTHGGGADISSSASVLHSKFVRGIFAKAKTDVGLFLDQGTLDASASSSTFGSPNGGGFTGGGLGASDHVFLPFFGGPDDRLALEFVVQVCATSRARGTVVRIMKTDGMATPGSLDLAAPPPAHLALEVEEEVRNEDFNASNVDLGVTTIYDDSIYDQRSIETRQQSESSDNALWARHAPTSRPEIPSVSSDIRSDESSNHASSSSSSSTISSRPRVVFKTLSTPVPLHAAISSATEASLSTETLLSESLNSGGGGKLVIVTGRSRKLAVVDHNKELKHLMDEHMRVGSEVRKTIGDVATAFVVAGVGSGIVVVQAADSEASDM